MKVQDIKIDDVQVVENVRISVRDKHLVELMNSIKQHGLLLPIGVTPTKSGKYVLIYGHRRLMACKKLGWNSLPAVIGAPLELKEHLLTNITENLQRRDNSPLELGRICHQLVKGHGMNRDEIASRLSVSKNLIQAAMETYGDVPAKLRERVRFMAKGGGTKNGDISAQVVRSVMSITRRHGFTEAQKTKLFEVAQREELSADDIDTVALMLKDGYTPAKAMSLLKDYKKFSVEVVANVHELAKLTGKYNVSLNGLFVKIVYGEIPPLKKLEFAV